MKISELRELLKDRRVAEEINKHLWIESQKAGYSIGIERATDEWIRLYAQGWLKYNKPEKYKKMRSKKSARKKAVVKKAARKKAAKKRAARNPTKKRSASQKKKTLSKKRKKAR